MPGLQAVDGALRAEAPAASAASATLAALALEVAAVAPHALGGILLRGPSGDARRRWLEALRAASPAGMPWRPIPIAVDADRLLGGLDLGATLASGHAVAGSGLLAEADGGIVLVSMAERMSAGTAAHVAAALDDGRVAAERVGARESRPARIAAVVLDEGEADDERAPRALADRVGLHLGIGGWPATAAWTPDLAAIERARAAWRDVTVGDEALTALTATAVALGIGSLRPPSHALVAARVLAALRGRASAARDDLEAAAALVLAPRATRVPETAIEREDATQPSQEAEADAATPKPEEPSPPPDGDPVDRDGADASDAPTNEGPLEERLIASAAAAIPPDLLALLASSLGPRRAAPSVGRSGAAAAHAAHGRPLGPRRGRPRDGVRLDLLATLRAAAPWQRARAAAATGVQARRRLHVRPSDLHVRRTEARRRTTTIFAVDASGSAALHRLGEAKGAVELLLADCYVRRDSVALVAFRGRGAEVLLPPTRSLTRAKRALGELPGGGGTPLAAGLDAAGALAAAVARRGETPVVVVLSDGRANVARDGSPGRAGGDRDARAAARRLAAQGVSTLFIDTSPRPDPAGRELAALLGGRCVALPHADAAALSRAVRGTSGAPDVRLPRHSGRPTRHG